jgi:hypothetical protein
VGKKSSTKKLGQPSRKGTLAEEEPVTGNLGTDTAEFHEMNVTLKEKKNRNRQASPQKRVQRNEKEKETDRNCKRDNSYMEDYLQLEYDKNEREIYKL